MPPRPRLHERTPSTFPSYHTSRKKPRRWPLVLRFMKGAIHTDIALAVLFHAIITAVVVFFDIYYGGRFEVPGSTISSLAIVVGLMLVFRNSTSYDRFWQGNQNLTAIETSIRNLTRSFLTSSHSFDRPPTDEERADTESTVRILLALLYATKNHLRAEWGQTLPLLITDDEVQRLRRESMSMSKPEYAELLPMGTKGHEDQGLSLALQLAIQIEGYIKRAEYRGWFSAPQASQLTAQLNNLTGAYGTVETIHLTPLPVAYLIHMRQVLAIFCCVLAFAFARPMGWWAILMVAFISFTLYGIEAIGAQLEDPFGYDRNDIKVDAIVEDLRVEMSVMLMNWRKRSDMFPSQRLQTQPIVDL